MQNLFSLFDSGPPSFVLPLDIALWLLAALLPAAGGMLAFSWHRGWLAAHAGGKVNVRFRLLPYFSSVSLCFVVLATVGLSLLYRQGEQASFFKRVEKGNQERAQLIWNGARSQLRPLLATGPGRAQDALQADPRVHELHQTMRGMIRDTAIVKVKLFALDGRALYSTELRQIGGNASVSLGFQTARAGTAATDLTQRDHFSGFEPSLHDRTLVSTYVPLRTTSTAPVEAVFEIHHDVTPELAALNQTYAAVTAVIAAILLLLYSGLILAVRRAGSMIAAEQGAQAAAAEALRASETRNRLLAETVKQSRDAIWTHDLEGVVTTWNRAAADMFGFTEAEAIGSSVRHLHMAGMSDAEWGAMYRKFAELVPANYEARRATRSGNWIDVKVITTPMFNEAGCHFAFIVSMSDVSAHKQIERDLAGYRERLEQQIAAQAVTVSELRFSEVRNHLLANVVKQSGEVIYTHDCEGVVTSWNEAATQLFGFSEEEAIGTSLRELHLASVNEVEYERTRSLFNQKTALTYEAQRCSKTGVTIDTAVSIAPLFSDDGAHIGGIVVMTNITARKRSERELAQYRTGLEEQVIERTAELRLARDAAQAASRAKSDFLAVMSHEIRTPMNGVLGMTELLLGTSLNVKQRRFAETVQRSGMALLGVINDILEFSRFEAGRLELEIGPFHMRDLAEDVVDSLADSARRKNLNFACSLPVDLPVRLMGDGGRLRQILINLAGNAIKFTACGDVLLRAAAVADSAPVRGTVVVRFEVIDSGIGLAKDQHERIFDAFTQAAGQSSSRYGGTGLGLSICKQLVEKMGGAIGVDSTIGHGSTFWFTLRLTQQAVAQALTATARTRLHTVGLKALIVDDNVLNQEVLGHQLATIGIQHESADGGVLGLEKLTAAAAAGAPFDLAVLDDKMPGLTGVELARAIRALPPLSSLPLMMLSSQGDNERAARAAGIGQYLTRPVRQSHLYDCVVSALRGKLAEVLAAELVPVPGAVISGFDAQVLLVEDHPVNQEFALAVLEDLGCRTSLANHGREALDLLARTAFDLVLMDCQMPVMDGFEATAEIRRREAAAGGSAQRIPVIALTAGAVAGDREKCLAAGMDDYMTKPFSIEHLSAALARWLPAAQVAAPPGFSALTSASTTAPSTTPGATPSASTTRIDRRVLERMQALRGGAAGAALVKRITSIYLGDASVRLDAMRAAVARNDLAVVVQCAHTLKSASANVGAMALADLCRQMEALGRMGGHDAAGNQNVPPSAHHTEGTTVDRTSVLLHAIDAEYAHAALELAEIERSYQ